jgi:HSP20 family molecular chaperone IbpA
MVENKKKKQSIYDMIREYLDEAEKLKEGIPSIERPSWDLRACTLEPLSSIFVTPKEVIITADLPYVEPYSVKVEPINSDRLEITAEMKRKVKFKEMGIVHHEGEFSSFSCQTRIPVPVDMQHIETNFKRGVLEIRIPRKRSYKILVE